LSKSCIKIYANPCKVIEFPGIVYIKPKPGNKNSLTHNQVYFNFNFLCNVENILEKSGFRTLGKLVKFTLEKKKKLANFSVIKRNCPQKIIADKHHDS
jgi:hypothetical protein